MHSNICIGGGAYGTAAMSKLTDRLTVSDEDPDSFDDFAVVGTEMAREGQHKDWRHHMW